MGAHQRATGSGELGLGHNQIILVVGLSKLPSRVFQFNEAIFINPIIEHINPVKVN